MGRSLVVPIISRDPQREAGEVFRAFLRAWDPGKYGSRRIGLLDMQRHRWLDTEYEQTFRLLGVDSEDLAVVERDSRFSQAVVEGGGRVGDPWWVFKSGSDGSVWFSTADCGLTVRVRRGADGPTAAEIKMDAGPAPDEPVPTWKGVPRNGGWIFRKKGR